MLNIDNKISLLPIWRYASKLLCYFTFAKLQTTADSNKVLHQQCAIYRQSNCQILAKSIEANNSYSGFSEVTPKHVSFRSLWIKL